MKAIAEIDGFKVIADDVISEKNNNKDYIVINQKLAFSAGIIAKQYSTQGLRQMIMPVYNILLGLNPAVIGLIFAFARFWDAITDAIAGKISDNSRSKHGRRRPMMAIGAVLLGCCFPLIWFVPEAWNDFWTTVYLCISLFVFYTCYTIYSVSYASIGMEMTACYEERTRLFAFRSLIQHPLRLGIPWLVALIYLDFFDSPLVGARFVGIATGLTIIITGLLTAYYCREPYQALAQKQEKFGIWDSLKQLRSNKPFLILVGVVTLKLFQSASIGTLGFYINSYYLFNGDIKAGGILSGLMGTIDITVSVLAAALFYRIAAKVDKKHILFFSLVTTAFGICCKWFTYNPAYPYLSLLTNPIMGFSASLFWIAFFSMEADICDWQEHQSGARQEGIISGVVSWFSKMGLSLGLLMSGILIWLTGFDATLKEGQSSDTMENMRNLFILFPLFSHCIAIYLVLKYPLTKNKMLEIRKVLEKRRGVVSRQ